MIMFKFKLFLFFVLLNVINCFLITDKRNSITDERFLDNLHYIHYDELKELFQNLTNTYPKLTKLHSIGNSLEKRELLALEINRNAGNRSLLTPMFKYVGNMHGDETIGRQLIIYLAQYLLMNYGHNSRVTQLVDNVDIFLMPSMNPDGFENSRESNCESKERYIGRNNANGVDLNRNFPEREFVFLRSKRSTAEIQPETSSIMDWIIKNPFVLSANLHGGAVVASIPFDNRRKLFENSQEESSRSPDHDIFYSLAYSYSKNNPKMLNETTCDKSEHPFKEGITVGAEWYELDGGMQDFNYIASNCFEISIELSCCKYPPANKLAEEWMNNKDSLLSYMEGVNLGVRGFVFDKENKPIANAFIRVKGRSKDIKTSHWGEYWRLLLPGTYDVQAYTNTYQSDYIQLSVEKDKILVQNFTLTKSLVGPLDNNGNNFNYSTAPLNNIDKNNQNHINNTDLSSILYFNDK